MKWTLRDYYIAFNMVQGIGGLRLQNLEKYFGSLSKAWHAPPQELVKVSGLAEKTVQGFCEQKSQICPKQEQNWAMKLGGRIVTLADSGYPPNLRVLAVPPPVLYIIGKLPQRPGIAIVGTRRPSESGRKQASYFGLELAKRHIPIISGLARGIDRAAHEAALRGGSPTIAVLGTPLNQNYPPEHKGLRHKICKYGAVVSEFSSRSPTVPGNFPRRNRIIAGLSTGVVVIQAGRRSGALITADWALEQGKDVWALPGEITDPLRQGTNWLIKQGAGLITTPQDILDSLPELDGQIKQQALPESEVAELYFNGLSPDEISIRLGIPIREVLSAITKVQLA